jgi:hypothetical protein
LSALFVFVADAKKWEKKMLTKKIGKTEPNHTRVDLSPLLDKWKSAYVARTEVWDFSGGMIAPGTCANEDSRGTGCEGAFTLGKKVVYPAESLVRWLEAKTCSI